MEKQKSAVGGLKYDAGKPRMELLPAEALIQVAEVLTYGAKKYSTSMAPGEHNWTKGIAYSRLLGAALRHIFSFMRGQDTDKESGLPHLAHAACCILFLLWMVKYRPGMDDRHIDPGTQSAQDLDNPDVSRMADGTLIHFGDQ